MAFEDKYLRTKRNNFVFVLSVGSRGVLTAIFRRKNDFGCLMGFQKDSDNTIERLTTECRKMKTKVNTLANHSKQKQRQSDHGENICEQVTNLSRRESTAGKFSNLPMRMRLYFSV